MFRKISILTVAAGVVISLAVPATVSATWKHHTTPIQENLGGSVVGIAKLQSLLGSFQCKSTGSALFTAGQTTGHIQSYGPVTNETVDCSGSGFLAGCQLHNWKPTGLPWPLHTGSGNTITISTGETHAQLTGAFCPAQSTTTTAGTVTLTPNQPNTITSGILSGTLQQHVKMEGGTSQFQVQVTGSGQIEAPNTHTYSI